MKPVRITKRPAIAGIFSVFSGLIGSLGILNYWLGFGPEGSGFGKGDIPPFVPSIIFSLPIPALIVAVAAVAGGIFMHKRVKYRWAMIGGVAAAASFVPFGVPALVLVAVSEKEFK